MNIRLLLLTAFFAGIFSASAQQPTKIRVLQFNIWQEGTVVPGGFEAVAEQIIAAKADVVTLSEVRNYHNTHFNDRMVEALAKRGQKWYSFYSKDSGILSRFPIMETDTVFPNRNDQGSVYKAVIKAYGHSIAVYTAHLDYMHGANYLPRGYHSQTWKKLPAPVTNVDSILKDNMAPMRDEAVQLFLADAKKERAKSRIVILGGDFNEPSPHDWDERTKNLFDHQGLIIPWQNVPALEKAGLVDAYRKKYPDVVSHPGFTFPSFNPDVDINKLIWGKDADERDRIDFIFYTPAKNITLKEAWVVGPVQSILRGKAYTEKTRDNFYPVKGIWPTDHKAVMAEFTLR